MPQPCLPCWLLLIAACRGTDIQLWAVPHYLRSLKVGSEAAFLPVRKRASLCSSWQGWSSFLVLLCNPLSAPQHEILQTCSLFKYSVLVGPGQGRLHPPPWPSAQFLPLSPGSRAEKLGSSAVAAAQQGQESRWISVSHKRSGQCPQTKRGAWGWVYVGLGMVPTSIGDGEARLLLPTASSCENLIKLLKWSNLQLRAMPREWQWELHQLPAQKRPNHLFLTLLHMI